MEEKTNITIREKEIIVNFAEAEIKHGEKSISVSAPSIVIQES